MSRHGILRLLGLGLCVLGLACQTDSGPRPLGDEPEYRGSPTSTMEQTERWAEDDADR